MSVMLMPGSLGDLEASQGAAASPAAAAAAAQQAAAAAAAAAAVQAAGQKDTTWTKLFVGGLPYHTTDKSLREHFSIFGDIEEAVVITDRQTGKSRGYGFVIMGDRPAADRACKDPNPIIDGRKANVNLAILGAKPRGTIPSLAAAFPGLRAAGYPTTAAAVLQPQYGLYSLQPALGWTQKTSSNPYSKLAVASPGYVYQNPYLTGAAGSLVSLGAAPSAAAAAAPLSHTAAAVAAATAASQFYEYQNAAAAAAAAAAASAYPGAAGLVDPYTSAAAANAASYMPYTYALPQTALPSAASALTGLSPYSAAAAQAASLQEARLQ